MRNTDRFGVLFSTYWTGPTGREIQSYGKDATILGLYLVSTHHANMIGLYDLPIAYVLGDLPVFRDDANAVKQAFIDLESAGFSAYYQGVVWVREMARISCWLGPDEQLKPNDKRHAAVMRLYNDYFNRALIPYFYGRYHKQLSLPTAAFVVPPDGSLEGLPRDIQGPQKSVISDQGTEIRSVPVSRSRASLVQPRRRGAAFEGQRLYVPQQLHAEFVRFRNHPEAEKELLMWYEAVSEEWTVGVNRHTPVGGDMFVFWRTRLSEKWPLPAVMRDTRPAWAREES